MASFIYVQKEPFSVRRLPAGFLNIIYPEHLNGSLLSAVIKQNDEDDSVWQQYLPDKMRGGAFQKVGLGSIDFVVLKSELEITEKVPSGSEDSDAFKFGSSDKLGLLLHYMSPEAWHTRDKVAHTSVHHHNESLETYHLLHGAAAVELRDVNTGERRTVNPHDLDANMQTSFVRGFTVRLHTQHPIVSAGRHSIMLISTNPPNNTKSDHIYDGLFRDIFPDIIASYTQKTRGLFAMG